MARILLLGGGFGGLYAALELEKRLGTAADVEITLVNRENFFLFTPMLHEVAASDVDLTDIVSPIRRILRRVNFSRAWWNGSTWRDGAWPCHTAATATDTNWPTTTWSSRWVRPRTSTGCPGLRRAR